MALRALRQAGSGGGGATLPSATTSQLYGGTAAANLAQPVGLGSNLEISGGVLNITAITATGATTARTLAARAADQYDARDFGGIWDGAAGHDVSSAIIAAIAAAAANGVGSVNIPVGNFEIGTTIINTTNRIRLRSIGSVTGYYNRDDTNVSIMATKLRWTGATGGTMFIAQPATSTSAVLAAVDVEGIEFDGQGVAAYGAKFYSVRGSKISVGYRNTTTAGILLDTAVLVTSNDVQSNEFTIVGAQTTTDGDGIVMQATAVGGTGNASFNQFRRILIRTRNGWGIKMINTDNNHFDVVSIQQAGGTGGGIWLGAGSGQTVINSYSGPQVLAKAGTYGNIIRMLDTSNGTAVPTYEVSSRSKFEILQYTQSNGFAHDTVQMASTMADLDSAASLMSASGRPTTTTQVILNGSSDHVRLYTADQSSSWGINLGGVSGKDFNIVSFNGGTIRLGAATAISGTLLSTGNIQANSGINFNSRVATTNTDLSQHVDLYGGTAGLSVSSGRMNIALPSTFALTTVVGSVDVMAVTTTGINAAAIGATTPSTGAFTTLAATSVAITGASTAATYAGALTGTVGATTTATGAFTTLAAYSGLNLGSAVAGTTTDLSKGIQLYGVGGAATAGFNISSFRMNIVLPSTLALTTVIGGVDVMAVSNTQVSLAVPLTLMPFTSTSIGGSSLTAGTCASTTVTITGLTTAMVIDTTPATYPGDAFYWRSYASAANTATVKVCAAAAGTPTASVFNLRVIQ